MIYKCSYVVLVCRTVARVDHDSSLLQIIFELPPIDSWQAEIIATWQKASIHYFRLSCSVRVRIESCRFIKFMFSWQMCVSQIIVKRTPKSALLFWSWRHTWRTAPIAHSYTYGYPNDITNARFWFHYTFCLGRSFASVTISMSSVLLFSIGILFWRPSG